jgi:thioesterase domain-containing protein
MESDVADDDFDQVVEQVLEAWRFSLERRDVGMDDDWHAVGGTSLDALDVAYKINEIFGGNFPLSSFAESPTVRKQAQWLVEHVADQPWSPIVRLRQGTTERPFFCVHPIGGNVLCYAEIAAAITSGQEFYGVQARGLDGVEQPLRSIPEMAAYSVAAIRDVQRKGPYHLGGWSAGGAVAFEVARLLQEQGERVAFLAMIDALYPDRSGAGSKRTQGEMREFEQIVLDNPKPMPEQYVAGLAVFNIFMEKWHLYTPQPYEGKVTMFVAEKQLSRMRNALADLRREMGRGPFGKARRALRTAERFDRMSPLRWHEVAKGGFEVITVPGGHPDMIRGEGAKLVARTLNERLA